MLMMWSIPLFAGAAVVGVVMAVARVRERTISLPVALIHGVLAAAGLVLLALSQGTDASAGPGTYALGLFVVAALGGFYLFAKGLRGQALPIKPMVLHAVIAVVAFVMLVAGAFLT